MESNPNVELIHLAIQKLIEEKKNREASGQSLIEDDDDHLLLSRLLSQLESLKGNDVLIKQAEESNEVTEGIITSPAVIGTSETKSENDSEVDGCSTKDIVKELKKVERQNSITHWLLSAMIVLTVTWQLSEVSLILNVKNQLSNPFKSVGSMLKGMLKGPNINGQNGEKHCSAKQQQTEAAALPPLKMPELPHMDLQGLGLNGDQKE